MPLPWSDIFTRRHKLMAGILMLPSRNNQQVPRVPAAVQRELPSKCEDRMIALQSGRSRRSREPVVGGRKPQTAFRTLKINLEPWEIQI